MFENRRTYPPKEMRITYRVPENCYCSLPRNHFQIGLKGGLAHAIKDHIYSLAARDLLHPGHDVLALGIYHPLRSVLPRDLALLLPTCGANHFRPVNRQDLNQ